MAKRFDYDEYKQQRIAEKQERDAHSNLLTVAEVADILRVDDTTVRRWIKQGALEAIALPHVHTRQGYRVRRSTLDDLLNGSALALQPEQDSRDGNQPAPRHSVRSGKA